jgi:hypothetical protein
VTAKQQGCFYMAIPRKSADDLATIDDFKGDES